MNGPKTALFSCKTPPLPGENVSFLLEVDTELAEKGSGSPEISLALSKKTSFPHEKGAVLTEKAAVLTEKAPNPCDSVPDSSSTKLFTGQRGQANGLVILR